LIKQCRPKAAESAIFDFIAATKAKEAKVKATIFLN